MGHLAPGLDDATVSSIVARAEGHPFHLEELCRAGAEGSPGESLLSLVEARIARLRDETRRALRAASLLGDRFELDALEHLLGDLDPEALATALREAVDAQLLVPLEAAGAHRFRQRLVRDAAMAMLPEADRRLGHRLAAEHLAARGGATAAVAHHWAEAGQPGQAAAWLTRAADEALAAHDLGTALALAARAEAQAPASAALLRVVAEAKVWLGRAVEALDAATRAMTVATPGEVDWLRAASVATSAAGAAGKPEGIAPIAERLLAIEARDAIHGPLLLALTRTSSQCYFTGAPALGRRLLERCDALLAGRADPLARARLAQVRSIAASFEGDPAAALDATREAIGGYRAIHDDRSACVCLSNLASILASVGRYVEAQREAGAAIALAELIELEPVLVGARITLASALLGAGQPASAAREAGLALARLDGSGHVRFIGSATIVLARSRLALGDAEGAASALEAVVSALGGVPSVRAQCLAVQAQIAISRGQPDRALLDATDAMSLMARAGADEGEALVRRAQVAALRASGRDADAERAVAEARAWLDAKLRALPPDLAAPMRAMPDHAFLLA